MSTTVTPPPAKKVNHIGLEVVNYKGSKTTLCAGCGHNSISERIIEAFYDLGVEPWTVAKFSGIGCSSKSPAYFLGLSHGFNGVHGRMPAIATGALLANSTLMGIGVSGDGDPASITELGVEPWTVAKFSGIGCSSKSPAYFLGLSHGFNGVHGRMPATWTGAPLLHTSRNTTA